MSTDAATLTTEFPFEPNPAEGRGITSGYLTELSNYLLGQMSWGRRFGLLPAGQRRPSAIPVIQGGLLRLDAILAIGESGYPLFCDPALGMKIEPLDLRNLTEGEHLIYACLASTRVPFGEPISIRRGEGDGSAIVAKYRAPQIRLVADANRAQYVDGLAIALVRCRNAGGTLATSLEPSFHPAVVDLAAWQHPTSPLSRLVEQGIGAIGQEREDPLARLARVELTVLGNVCSAGDPEVALVQAQRCLGLLRAMLKPPLALPGQLEQMTYAPGELWRFMALLADSLDRIGDDHKPLPDLLKIDGQNHLHLEGQFKFEDPLWHWVGESKQVTSIALYFPYAIQADLPLLLVGRSRESVNRLTRAVPVEAAGTAIALQDISNAVDSIYITSANAADGPRLRNNLGTEHALYYR
jgi:hypothetical protein